MGDVLYRHDGPELPTGTSIVDAVGAWGRFIPVEPCEHGKIDSHEYWFTRDCSHADPCESAGQCEGAPELIPLLGVLIGE